MRTLAIRRRANTVDYEGFRRAPIKRYDKDHLNTWMRYFLGVSLPRVPVCRDHAAPLDIFSDVYFHDHPVALILGPRGGGKAQPLTATVQTPSGPVFMGDLAIGDEVCHPDGGTSRIVGVFPQGMKDIYRIRFRDGSHVDCCIDHLWEVESKSRQWRVSKVVDTRYILENYQSHRGDKVLSIRLPDPIRMRSRKAKTIPPYTMGALLGDGTFRSACLSFSTDDEYIKLRIESELPSTLVVKYAGQYDYRIVGEHRGVKPNPYVTESRRLGLWRLMSDEKFIPREYLIAPERDRWNLLQGIIDTDGYVSETGKLVFYSVSRRLAEDVQFLVETLGGICRIGTKVTTGKLCYVVGISLEDPHLAIGLPRKRSRVKDRVYYHPKRIIVGIDRIGKQECQCIKVDAADGLYLTDHCIVTHNTMMSSLDSHLRARYDPNYDAKIIGGSLEQSKQVKENIDSIVIGGGGQHGRDEDVIRRITEKKIVYVNGPEVSFLPASNKAARGPHIPGLKIDEVDEVPRTVLESAVGMAQGNIKKGLKTSILMTSTWHNDGGLMGEMIQKAKENRYPFHRFCVFEVLEKCPESRSGRDLEKCPECPIVRWCHEDRGEFPGWEPKAKRSNGHYPIETLIQKCLILGEGVIKADYLCRGPKSEGLWFVNFDERENVLPDRPTDRWAGIYHPEYPLYVSIDYGVCTGAVAFQVRKKIEGKNVIEDVHIIGDYYHENRVAEENAQAIAAAVREWTKGRDINDTHHIWVTMDLAARAKNPIGPTGVAEYHRGGIRNIAFWPAMQNRKRESLELLNSFVKAGSGRRHLFINPGCKHTISAFKNYTRKKRGDDYYPDTPADPQHPFEEIIDAISGGLLEIYPNGRGVTQPGVRVPFRRFA